eukprot:2787876-Pleurochrysis_carterae.AAC.1
MATRWVHRAAEVTMRGRRMIAGGTTSMKRVVLTLPTWLSCRAPLYATVLRMLRSAWTRVAILSFAVRRVGGRNRVSVWMSGGNILLALNAIVGVKVDHVALAAVDVRHAHVVYVIADDVSGCDWYWHVRS